MSLMLPKNQRCELPRHLDYIRSLPCVLCSAPPPSEAAHLRMGLGGGTGVKPHDYWTLPLCHAHHAHQHRVGEHVFWATKLQTDRQLMVKVMRAFARSLYSDEMTDYGR
jgi:hypothetical protein